MLPCRGPTGCLAPPGCSPVQGSGGALLQASIPPVFGSTPSPAACSPRGRGARGVECPSPALAAEVTHCSVTPGAFGLLGGGWVQGFPHLEGPGAKHLTLNLCPPQPLTPTAPQDPVPSATPPLSAPASYPYGALVRFMPPGAARSSEDLERGPPAQAAGGGGGGAGRPFEEASQSPEAAAAPEPVPAAEAAE